MKNKKNWIIAIILAVAVVVWAVKSSSAPIAATATATAITSSAYGGCAYTWAYHDAPGLTENIGAAVSSLDPQARAHANLYGEDCLYPDGHKTFSALETDFYVRLPVKDLSDEEFLGNWMARVMPLIVQIPRAEIQGNYGFVEFWFEQGEAEHIVVRIPIQKYKDTAQEKSGVELYRLFSSPSSAP